jgi:hypothetical protein
MREPARDRLVASLSFPMATTACCRPSPHPVGPRLLPRATTWGCPSTAPTSTCTTAAVRLAGPSTPFCAARPRTSVFTARCGVCATASTRSSAKSRLRRWRTPGVGGPEPVRRATRRTRPGSQDHRPQPANPRRPRRPRPSRPKRLCVTFARPSRPPRRCSAQPPPARRPPCRSETAPSSASIVCHRAGWGEHQELQLVGGTGRRSSRSERESRSSRCEQRPGRELGEKRNVGKSRRVRQSGSPRSRPRSPLPTGSASVWRASLSG